MCWGPSLQVGDAAVCGLIWLVVAGLGRWLSRCARAAPAPAALLILWVSGPVRAQSTSWGLGPLAVTSRCSGALVSVGNLSVCCSTARFVISVHRSGLSQERFMSKLRLGGADFEDNAKKQSGHKYLQVEMVLWTQWIKVLK